MTQQITKNDILKVFDEKISQKQQLTNVNQIDGINIDLKSLKILQNEIQYHPQFQNFIRDFMSLQLYHKSIDKGKIFYINENDYNILINKYNTIQQGIGEITSHYTYPLQNINYEDIKMVYSSSLVKIPQQISNPIIVNEPIKLMTYNMYGGACSNFKTHMMYKNTPDIILTQETRKSLEIYINNLQFKLPDNNSNFYNGEKSGSMVGIFSQNGSQNDIINTIPITSTNNINSKDYSRYGIIFEYKNIKIANLHLEGGRYTNDLFLNNFTEFLKFKLDLINLILKSSPDIICGDFNSVIPPNSKDFFQIIKEYDSANIDLTKYNNYEFLTSQFATQTNITDDIKKNLVRLNLEPYNLLSKNGYRYANPLNSVFTSQHPAQPDIRINQNGTDNITNGRGNTIIDCFWYNPKRVESSQTKIINIMKKTDDYESTPKKCISDHNPVYSEFVLI